MAAFEPGSFIVVRGGIGIPSLVQVQDDGAWLCVAGIFKGRELSHGKKVVHVCEDGDVFEDLGVEVRGRELVPVSKGGTKE